MDQKCYLSLKDDVPARSLSYVTSQNQLTNTLAKKTEVIVSEIVKHFEGFVATARGHDDHSIYTGYSGLALMHFLIYKKTKVTESMKIAKVLTELALTKLTGTDVSFLTGDAGPLALGIIIYAMNGNMIQSSLLRLSLIQLGENSSSGISCALIDGWAGYLYALLFVNKHVPNLIPFDVLRKIVMRIIDRGMKNSFAKGSNVPLVFEWKRINYHGALYGTCGILYMIMCANVLEESELSRFVRPTLDELILRAQKSDQVFVPHEKSNLNLIQWDHGAPGYIPLFIKASEVFHPSYFAYAKSAARTVWKHGLLRKGYALCHGVAGNAYSFLSIFRKNNDRRQLMRAMVFVEWCFGWPKHENYLPDRPFSLFKGYPGIVYLLTDVKDTTNTLFPGYEL